MATKMLSVVFMLFCFTAFSQESSPTYGPYNSTTNPYWPLTIGNRWVFSNTSTGEATVLSVQSGPSYFGCMSFDGSSQVSSATSLVEVDFRKVDPATYWNPGDAFDLRWVIGVQPSSSSFPFPSFAGWVYPFGGWAVNYKSGWPFTTIDHSFNTFSDDEPQPGELLLPPTFPFSTHVASPSSTSIVTYYANDQYQGCLIDMPSGSTNCATGDFSPGCYVTQDSIPSDLAWTVSWSSQSIATPGYSGSALEAQYDENGLQEYWYFANNVGPVAILAIDEGAGGVTEEIELVNFTAGNGSTAASPDVYLSDEMAAQQASKGLGTGSMTFSSWGTVFEAVTNTVPPTTTDACTTNSSDITLTQYLSLVSAIGSSSCPNSSYTPSNIETITSEMSSYAESNAPYNAESPNLTWQDWSTVYSKVTGKAAPAPQNYCFTTSDGVYFHQWLRMPVGQWLWIFEKIHGCA